MSTRRQAICLYRHLLREAEKIPAYNFRMYALRKIRDSYRENRCLNDHDKIDEQLLFGRQSLELIRRQAIVGCLYSAEKLVIEKRPTLRPSDD